MARLPIIGGILRRRHLRRLLAAYTMRPTGRHRAPTAAAVISANLWTGSMSLLAAVLLLVGYLAGMS